MEETLKMLLSTREETKKTIKSLEKTITAIDTVIGEIVSAHDCKSGQEHGCEICDIINQPD